MRSLAAVLAFCLNLNAAGQSLVIETGALPVAYADVPNPILFHIEGFSKKSIIAKANNGQLFYQHDTLFWRPDGHDYAHIKDATISFFSKGKRKAIAEKKFQLQFLPMPTLAISKYRCYDCAAGQNLKTFHRLTSLKLVMDDPQYRHLKLDTLCKVISFDMLAVNDSSQQTDSFHIETENFTTTYKAAIDSFYNGRRNPSLRYIVFKNILMEVAWFGGDKRCYYYKGTRRDNELIFGIF
jgi:hypothetical protein